jgi:hypothetical protein
MFFSNSLKERSLENERQFQVLRILQEQLDHALVMFQAMVRRNLTLICILKRKTIW